jgi:hypothetical protein
VLLNSSAQRPSGELLPQGSIVEEHLAASSHLSNISKRKEHHSKEQPRKEQHSKEPEIPT